MARITLEEAQAWAEETKLTLTALDADLLAQVETQVVGRLAAVTDDTESWVSTVTTPEMVRTVIAMFYVAWVYDRQYSEEQEQLNDYAVLLRAQGEALLQGMLDGSIDLPGVEPTGQPAHFPTDESSLREPSPLAPADGPGSFFMGRVF